MAQDESNYVVTTRPIVPPYEEHPTIFTSDPRIFLRPFRVTDLDELHELRSQIEVMKWTSTGRVDADVQATRTWMKRSMKPEDDLHHATEDGIQERAESASPSATSFNFVIVYREDDLEGEATTVSSSKVIGAGGCHVLNPRPECGYMIRKEYWGQGIATAVLKAVLEAYWKLERKTAQIAKADAWVEDIEALSVKTEGGHDVVEVRERLKATIEATNRGSQRVLEKCNFRYHSSETVPENGTEVKLAHYYLNRP